MATPAGSLHSIFKAVYDANEEALRVFMSLASAFDVTISGIDSGVIIPVDVQNQIEATIPSGTVLSIDDDPPINVELKAVDSAFPTLNVDVLSMPSVTIGSMPNVTIDSIPDITIASGEVVGIDGNVNIGTMPNVTIAVLPDITIATGETIGISSIPNITVDSLPDITITSGETIGISGTVDVDIVAQTLSNLSAEITSLPSINIATGEVVGIDGSVDIGTLPDITIASGEVIGIDGTVDIDKQATNSGDYDQVSISDSATQIIAADTTNRKRGVLITNITGDDVFIGFDGSVTTSTGGTVIKEGGAVVLPSQKSIYGICASGESALVGYLWV